MLDSLRSIFDTPLESMVADAMKKPEPDWSLNMRIIDNLNYSRNSELCKEAVTAIKRRLTKPNPPMGALLLVEAFVMNAKCRELVKEVENPEFLDALAQVALQPAQQRPFRTKALSLIATWAADFERAGSFPNFAACHRSLLSQGVEFPPRSSTVPPAILSPPPPAPVMAVPIAVALPVTRSLAWPEFVAKTASEFRVVHHLLHYFREMIGATSSEELRLDPRARNIVSVLTEVNKRLALMMLELEDPELLDLCVTVSFSIRVVLEYFQSALHAAPGTPRPPPPALDDLDVLITKSYGVGGNGGSGSCSSSSSLSSGSYSGSSLSSSSGSCSSGSCSSGSCSSSSSVSSSGKEGGNGSGSCDGSTPAVSDNGGNISSASSSNWEVWGAAP